MGAPQIELGDRARIDSLMRAELGILAGRRVTGRDLLAAGSVSGGWRRLERELALGLAMRAEEAPAGRAPAPSAISPAQVLSALSAEAICSGALSACGRWQVS